MSLRAVFVSAELSHTRRRSRRVVQAEMIFVLTSMNNVSSWFGDAAMTQEQIEKLVDEANARGRGRCAFSLGRR